jgi:adenylosuccinate synthase
VARTYPIRVANRFDDKGKMIGWSGPHYPDQEEIRWEQIGVAPELTTVTKLPRRIFTFSEQQIREAVRANGNVQVFLNFCNYLQPAPIDFLCRDDADHVWPIIQSINRIPGALVCWTGWGPKDSDIREVA